MRSIGTRQSLTRAVAIGLLVLLTAACGADSEETSTTLSSDQTAPGDDSTVPDDGQASDVPGVTDSSIKIGMTASITGAFPLAGEQFSGWYERTVDQINAAGGINGRTIELTILDDGSEGDVALSNAQRLVRDDEVFAMTTVGTATTAGILPFLESEGVPLLFPAAFFPELIDPPKDNAFALFPLYDAQLTTVIEWAFGEFGPGSAVIVRAEVPAFDAPVTAAEALIPELGGEHLQTINTSFGEADWGSVIIRLQDLQPDYVVMMTSAPDQGRLFQEMSNQGYAPGTAVLGASTLVDQAFLDAAGEVPDGTIYGAVAGTLVQTAPEADECRELWPEEPMGPYGLNGCASAEVMAEALRQLGDDVTREGLTQLLDSAFGPFELPYTGVIESADNHLLNKGIGIATITGGEFVAATDEVIQSDG